MNWKWFIMLLINIITIIKITRRLKIFIKILLNLIELLKVKQAEDYGRNK